MTSVIQVSAIIRVRGSKLNLWLYQRNRTLPDLVRSCTFCLVHGINSPKHLILDCPTLVGLASVEAYLLWRRSIFYQVGVLHPPICYLCHQPQGTEGVLHPPFDGNPEHCRFRDMVAPLVYGVLTKPTLRMDAQIYFPSADLSTPMTAIDWINGMPISGNPSNLIALFMWYCRNHL